MSLSASTRRFAILLLLFCLPFQLVSAAALDCLHADSNSPAMKSMACHAVTLTVDADTEDADNLTQCQKCALGLALLAAPSDMALQPVIPLALLLDEPRLLFNTAKVFLPPLQRPPLLSGLI